MNESHIRNVIEAAMLAAGKPLQARELLELFDEGVRPKLEDIQAALAVLAEEYSNRGIEIKETAAGFRIQVRREMANEISRLWPERPAKYSRALLETLALIAYRQPITRAEIEAVRGVAVNPNILKTVIERNWVRVVGHRDVPGRPELLGTTRDFLDYFGLRNLDELPPLAELKTLGEIKVQYELPTDAAETPSEADNGTAGVDAANTQAVVASAEEHTSDQETKSGRESSDGEGHTTKVEATAESGVSENAALHEAEEFAATLDAELAEGDEDSSEDDELSAAGPASSELVAGPRDLDD